MPHQHLYEACLPGGSSFPASTVPPSKGIRSLPASSSLLGSCPRLVHHHLPADYCSSLPATGLLLPFPPQSVPRKEAMNTQSRSGSSPAQTLPWLHLTRSTSESPRLGPQSLTRPAGHLSASAPSTLSQSLCPTNTGLLPIPSEYLSSCTACLTPL